tara:strand:- start:11022 stop:12467 length:1446 start_codon:yes stop_codon:yes gene_type:complete
MANRTINSVTSTSGSFTADDDGFQWISFRYLPDDRSVIGLFQQFSGLKLNTRVKGHFESSFYSQELFGGPSWSDPSFPIEFSKMYKIKNIGGLTFDFTGTTKYVSNRIDFVDGYNWSGYLSTKSVTVTELDMDILGIEFIGHSGSSKYSIELFGGASWSDPNFTFNPNDGIVVYMPSDSSKKYIEWPQDDPPVDSGPQSSGNPTFDIDILSNPSNSWTEFKIKINTSTMNPYEFYTSSDNNNSFPASVTRNGDSQKEQQQLVNSNLDTRYEQIRSIELVMNKHVYFSININDDSIKTIAADTSDNNKLHANYDNMYLYCSRTTINSLDETSIMIVNAHNHLSALTSSNPMITIEQTFFINTPNLSKADILGYINWGKTYMGTTSIYKAEYDPGTTGNPSYVHTKYNDTVGDTIRDYYWKLKDDAQEASSAQGLFLRYSLDDGNQIIEGGVSNESFTSHGTTSRVMIDDMYIFGNIDGNIEE